MWQLDGNKVHANNYLFSGMEKAGFIKTVDNLLDNNDMNIDLISTDRHVMIRKLMATNTKYKHIKHQFDPWHIAKGILKKLVKFSKKKGLYCFKFQKSLRWKRI